jgi:2-oxoisovalerate dehydrogenase E1 component
MALRYRGSDRVVCCFAGDGAYANGVVLESLNWASQEQWTNHLAGEKAAGLPVIYLIVNNHYGMTHRTDEEVMGVNHLARRAAGFAQNNMHAETVNGMDVLAVRDAIERAAAICREGNGPVLVEASTYRYYGHSLSDPRNEYRTNREPTSGMPAPPSGPPRRPTRLRRTSSSTSTPTPPPTSSPRWIASSSHTPSRPSQSGSAA